MAREWEEIADLNYQQSYNNYQYDWENVQRQYNHMLLQNEVQRHDQIVQHQYQTEQQKQQWMYANALREQKYNAEMAAFNKSEKMYGWQIDMNQISAAMALDDQRAQTNERYQALSFEAQLAVIQQATKKTDLAIQGMGADLDTHSKRSAGQTKKQALTLKQQTERGKAAVTSIENVVKDMQATGKAEARGQAGGSIDKQYQAIAAQSSRLRAAHAHELSRSDFATRLAINGIDQTLAEQEAASNLANVKIGAAVKIGDLEYALGMKQRDATKLSISAAHDRAAGKIEHDQYVANVQADFNRISAPSMGVPIPKPLEIPMATIIDPIVPVKGKPPVWGAGMGPTSAAGSLGAGGSPSGSNAAIGGMIGMGLGVAAAMIPGIGWGISALTLAGAGGSIGSFIGGLFG